MHCRRKKRTRLKPVVSHKNPGKQEQSMKELEQSKKELEQPELEPSKLEPEPGQSRRKRMRLQEPMGCRRSLERKRERNNLRMRTQVLSN